MSSAKKKKASKAEKLETEGDKLAGCGKYEKALKKYRKALQEDPDRPGLYDKLVKVRDQMPADWEMEDFVESVSWTMKKQELDEPAIRQVHAKLTPEWRKASDVALKVLLAPEEDPSLPPLIEELVGYGETGTRVLIELVRQALRQKERPEK